MSKAKPITPAELEQIKQSVERAWRRVLDKQVRIHRAKRMRTSAEPDLTSEKWDRRWLEYWTRKLKTEAFSAVIAQSAARGDTDFFIQLGKQISTNIFKIDAPLPGRLDAFLIGHWAERRDGLPELFRLSPSDLTYVCCLRLDIDQAELNEEAVAKARQRLGLRAFKRGKLKLGFDKGGNPTFSEPDN